MTDPTPEEIQARRALHCLYIAVDEGVAESVSRDVLAWVRAAEAAMQERCAIKVEIHFDGENGPLLQRIAAAIRALK